MKWFKEKYRNFEMFETSNNDSVEISWHTPYGILHACIKKNHYTEFPVKKIEDLDAWKYIKENTFYELNPQITDEDIRNIYCLQLSWSPVQQLIQFDIGIENFYFFLVDNTDNMEDLMALMQQKNMERLKLSLELDVPVIYQPENTSTTAISPKYYEQYTVPHIKEAADIVHEANKRYLVHMCGLIRDLIRFFPRTGMDGIHSVTPPPIGDTPFDFLRKNMNPDFTIIGRFNADMWVGKKREEIQKNLESILSKDILATPFMLWVTTDQIAGIHYNQIRVLKEAMRTYES